MNRYQLVHVTRYEYDDAVTTSYGRAHLVPCEEGGQRRLAAELEVSPPPADLSEHTDFFGNTCTYFCVRSAHTVLSVTSRSVVEVSRTSAASAAAELPAWEDVRAGAAEDPEIVEYQLPSPRLASAPEVERFARTVFTPGRPLGEALVDLLSTIHSGFEYKPGATTVRTTLPQLLRLRKGVCQDFAHLAIGALRSVGLPARYVSGYLETYPPPGQVKLQGADASHAWVSVFAGPLGWVDIDPTNDQFVDDRYIVAARGRDYGDVPPLKGIIVTDAKKSTMHVGVDVIRLD